MKFFLFLSALATATALLATPMSLAHRLSGRIIDADLDLPLEYATVSALDDTGTLVDGASTDSLGRFELVLPKGVYTLRFAFIGYEGRDSVLTLKQDLDLGDIKLRVNAVSLDAATVTAERSQLSLKLNKQIFDVGADLVSQGGSANEVLNNVPMVQISPEGVVSLRGNNSVTVLINGKPSAMADNNALQGIPASNIARVEVITTPSSRYEAAGSGGIINIILKAPVEKNWGGQLSASVGIPADYRLNGSFSVTRPLTPGSNQTITYYGNAGLRLSNYFSTGSANRISRLPTGTQFLFEDLSQERQDRSWNGFGGIEIRPSGKTSFSASYSVYHQTNDDTSSVGYRYLDEEGNTQGLLKQEYAYLEPETYHQIEVAWSQDLAREGQKLRLLFQNDFWDNNEEETMRFNTVLPAGQIPRRLNTRSLEGSNDYLLQGDYEQKLAEYGKLEFGFRAETRIISSDYLAEQFQGQTAEVFMGLKNVVDYTERIGAAYAQYAYERDKWGLQLGLRNEYTFVKVKEQDGSATIEKRYNKLFPTATVSYQLNEGLGSSLSYSRRLRRPYFGQLNPFGGLDNPNQIEYGNPDLNPSFTDQLELKLLYRNDKLTLNPYVFGSRVLGFFDTYARQDDGGTVSLLPINLDRELQVGTGLIVTYAPSKDWQITAEASAAYFEQRGIYEGVDFGNAFRTGNAQLSARGKVWWKLRVQARFSYSGPQRYAQTYRKAAYGLNCGISRAFLSDRLTVTANVRNAFRLLVYRGGAERESFSSSYSRVWQGQRAQLTVAWDLGKAGRLREARGSIR